MQAPNSYLQKLFWLQRFCRYWEHSCSAPSFGRQFFTFLGPNAQASFLLHLFLDRRLQTFAVVGADKVGDTVVGAEVVGATFAGAEVVGAALGAAVVGGASLHSKFFFLCSSRQVSGFGLGLYLQNNSSSVASQTGLKCCLFLGKLSVSLSSDSQSKSFLDFQSKDFFQYTAGSPASLNLNGVMIILPHFLAIKQGSSTG